MESDPFKTRDHVANFDEVVKEYQTRSERSRLTLGMLRNVPYGNGGTETLDLFFPPAPVQGCPVHLFIHGGYWRMFSKDDFSFIADPVTACGAIAAIMDYDLMPNVRMEKIVDQVQRAFSWLHGNIFTYGGDPERLSISGHSAGAHLATFLFTTQNKKPLPKSVLLLSGLYDLEPLQTSFLQPLIAITDEEVRDFSPLQGHHSAEPQVIIAYGSQETEPFLLQAGAFCKHLTNQGVECSIIALPSANHMSAARDLGLPATSASKLLQSTIKLS